MADTGTPSNAINSASWVADTDITAGPHTTAHADTKAKFAAHTHDLTANSVDDAELVDLRVRSVHASEKWALVSGSKAVSLAGGALYATVYFNTATQGDPAFAATPNVQIIIRGGSQSYTVTLRVINSSSVTCTIKNVDGGTQSESLTLDWHAYGKVA